MSLKLSGQHINSKGFAQIFLVLLALVVVGAGGFAFWRVTSYNNKSDINGKESVASNGVKSNSATVSDECVARTGDENICRLGAIADLSRYSSEVHSTINGLETVVKYDGKGNSETTVGDLGGGISVGGRYYISIENVWYDNGEDPSGAPDSNLPDLGFATSAGVKYENLGKEPCGNDTCFKYKMTGGVLTDGTVICWFGDKDYLPRRYESTGGLLGSLTMTIDYKPVTISAPAGARPINSLTLQ